MTTLRHVNLRVAGGYRDVYTDSYAPGDHLHIVARKLLKGFKDHTFEASSVFEPIAELEEWPDIWAAVTTVWTNRGTYTTRTLLLEAFDDALAAGGYTGPGGVAL